ncbi:fibronectin type III domain-containing protein [Kriegella aquimaris]|uniref:Fibronectin type-III domain-containing protein n=1 Tax=Kriegella aquimaris TaxID=192904 RepID=A0A1G9LVP0_9FLAO|nr:hypothetical protein [Kriegella aquimaris]SDL66162.1 hypothetical protein SAMN04488514_102255 [Kriegella aquimaris]
MKQIIVILFLICNLAWGQDTSSVQVIARSLPDKVLLRWAVDEPLAWKMANEYGFLVERATISRNGEAVVPIERQMLTSYPLKPKPLVEWEILANQDQNAAVLAQALYGDSFETVTSGSGTLGQITAVNDELEQRFTFGLLSAEQNYQGALLAGWALEDTSVKQGEKYLYKVSVALPADISVSIKEGTVYASPDLYEELPKPVGLAGVFQDESVLLSWNFNLLSSSYTSYVVERSEDGINFVQQNGKPIFNASHDKEKKEVSLFYSDSIPNNKTFYYRIKGKTAFGEVGPASESIFGKATQALGFVPRIYRKEIPTDNKAILFWEFKEEGNALISKFQLKRGNTNDGPFETVVDNIPVTARKIAFESLKRINYFVITAVGKNGIDSESYSSMVQPVDSIPPAPPVELKGVMDTTGLVKLTWAKNSEKDLKGYRIFKANNANDEFSEVTNKTFEAELYVDTVHFASLNKKIFYKIQAEDQRYNRSKFSEVLTVNIPDMMPPSPPVLTKYEVIEEGIRIHWIPSSSVDVQSHVVYRKNGQTGDNVWQKRFESTTMSDSSFLDTGELEQNLYSYTIIAKDSLGLESKPSNPITIVWKGKTLEEGDIKFIGTVNRELRFVNLSWKVKNQKVSEFRLYRGTDKGSLKLYKTFDGDVNSFHDVDLEINSEYTYGLQVLNYNGLQSMLKKIAINY